jgi:CRISPR-associated protein Csm1
MSEQLLLQGQLLGIEQFLLSPPGAMEIGGEDLLPGRSMWVTLLCEVLPRGLLAELGLPLIMLGSSGGGQFLLVLPGPSRAAAEAVLERAAASIASLGAGLRLIWSVTENLGDWTVVRRRLNDDLRRQQDTPLAAPRAGIFEAFDSAGSRPLASFRAHLDAGVRQAASVGWRPEDPAAVSAGGGKHTWKLTPNLSLDGITLARHAAPSDDGSAPANLQTLASRAEGAKVWGVLRGDVDGFGIRLRRVASIEEHVQVSVLYKQFLENELEVLCSLPDFWRKVTILYSGGDEFAVYGAWDALIALAREMQRLFSRFTEENLKEFPGAEGKTITMALSLASGEGASLSSVYGAAGADLERAKTSSRDCFSIAGRTLEWKRISDAADLKDTLLRMSSQFRSSRQFLFEMRGLYGKAGSQKIWRFERRLSAILSGSRDREVQRMRARLVSEIIGRHKTEVNLRPAGLVALDWARLASGV